MAGSWPEATQALLNGIIQFVSEDQGQACSITYKSVLIGFMKQLLLFSEQYIGSFLIKHPPSGGWLRVASQYRCETD